MGGKYSNQRERFPRPILLIAFTFVHIFHQIVTHLPYNSTEIVRFKNTFKFWGFFDKKDGFQEKNLYFYKIAQRGKLAVECV